MEDGAAPRVRLTRDAVLHAAVVLADEQGVGGLGNEKAGAVFSAAQDHSTSTHERGVGTQQLLIRLVWASRGGGYPALASSSVWNRTSPS